MWPFSREMTAEELKKRTAEDFQNGTLLLADKPLGWTSFDVVKKVRYLIRKKFGLKKIKVGHAGTLDPLATGLLVLCTGRYTKKITELTLDRKTYTGSFRLGETTPSFDLETEVDRSTSVEGITAEDVRAAAEKLSGVSMQMPPQFSAKLVDGKRAYLSARAGKTVELKAREVEISDFQTDAARFPEVDFSVTCTSGTYIRALARDLGEILGCGAHLIALRRTASGAYRSEDALTVPEIEDALTAGASDV